MYIGRETFHVYEGEQAGLGYYVWGLFNDEGEIKRPFLNEDEAINFATDNNLKITLAQQPKPETSAKL